MTQPPHPDVDRIVLAPLWPTNTVVDLSPQRRAVLLPPPGRAHSPALRVEFALGWSNLRQFLVRRYHMRSVCWYAPLYLMGAVIDNGLAWLLYSVREKPVDGW